MDIYVMLDGAELVGASARLQGAELIRSEYAHQIADANWPDDPDEERRLYDRVRVVNTELRDLED